MPEPSIDPSAVLCFGPFSLDVANAQLLRDGQALVLVPKDLDVLCFLARRAGRLVTKDELLDAVWARRFVSESVLKNVVSRLRAVLGDEARQPRYIETAQRRGYRFIAEVSVVAPARAPAAFKLDAAATAPLVGRAQALGWLHRQLDNIHAGQTRVVLLAGEAGIGKSRLIERFTQTAAQSEAVWSAFGQCVEHAGGVEPYLPVLEALSALCRAQPDAGWVALMRQVAPTWLLQLPWYVTAEDRLQLQQEVSGATQDRMLREFGELVDRLTVQRPLLLVIEDLHWSDHATLQLMAYLARRRGSARVLLLGSLRPAEVIVSEHPLKAMRQALRQQRLCDELDLDLFSESDAAEYLSQRLGGARWPEPLVRALHEHTGGLPLFMAAVVDELSAQGRLPRAGDAEAQALQQVPRSIFGLIEQQHGRLPEQTQRWLEAASVAGVEFLHAPLADALRVDADSVQSVFDALVRGGGWLRSLGPAALPDGRVAVRYTFRHAVYRHVLYELAGAAGRVQLHRQLAAALLQAYATQADAIAADVAVHFEKGQDAAQAVRHLAVAANRALRRFAAAEAAAIAQRALALLGTLADRSALRDTEVELQVVVGVAMAELKGLMSSESREAFSRTVGLMDGLRATPARVPALHGIWWATLVRGDMKRARGMAEQTLALAEARGDEPLRFAGHSALGITLVHIGDMAAAQRHLTLALTLHQSTGSEQPVAMFSFDPVVQLTSYLATSLWHQGQPGAAGQRSQAALARAEHLKHPMTLVLALQLSALLHGFAAEFDQVADLAERALQLGREQRLERESGAPLWLRGSALAAAGDVEAGLAMMRQGKALQLQHGLGYGLTHWHESYAKACLQSARLDEAHAAVVDGLALADENGEHAASAELQRIRGCLLQGRGQHAEADAAFGQALNIAQRQAALVHELAALVAWGRSPEAKRSEVTLALAEALKRWTDPIELPLVAEARATVAAQLANG
ncbi:MAG: AAA family ATPase [Burkholderiaceae bacterium]